MARQAPVPQRPVAGPALFQQACALQQQGQLAAAEAAFTRLLKSQPRHFGSLQMLGAMAYRQGDYARALAWFEQAAAADPAQAGAHSNQGLALHALQRYAEAVASYGRALERKNDLPEAWFNRGNALRALGQREAALSDYAHAIGLRPDYADALQNLGNLLQDSGQPQGALQCYERVLLLQPSNTDVWCKRGNVQQQLGLVDAALESFAQALSLAPQDALLHYNHANALYLAGRFDTALQGYERAIALDAGDAHSWVNRGNTLFKLRRMDAAVQSYERAIALQPGEAQPYYNRGNALVEQLQLDAAIASYDQALVREPDNAQALLNKGYALLLQGNLAAGWPLYEWRWQEAQASAKRPQFAQPRWTGAQPLAGKTLLLHCEQGLGDTLQFCRYCTVVAALGARVLLVVPPALLALLHGLDGVDTLLSEGQALPPFDYHCSLLSLPLALGTQAHTIPAGVPYLRADATRCAAWSQRLGARSERLRIGLVWSGSPTHRNDARRSIALQDLLAVMPADCELISVQKDVRATDQAALTACPRLREFSAALNDFADTAALCAQLDLLVSVDTSVAHLGAALGLATWILLPYRPDWRWQLGRSDSPWYPSVRLLRQQTQDDWSATLQRLHHDLSQPFAKESP